MSSLVIQNLHVKVGETNILTGLNLVLNQGEIHAIMGPNGTGKSTLAYTIMGHPAYTVTEGDILLDGESILDLEADERAHKGLFLAFQYPVALPGVTVANFLRTALNSKIRSENNDEKGMSVLKFRQILKSKMDLLRMDYSFGGRYLNEGFSGGEKKRAEILQMAVLEPRFAVLDETDSGLDIDALRIVSEGVNALSGENLGVLLITHYQRILNYIHPNYVHIMYGGRVVESGEADLAHYLEANGYDWVREKYSLLEEN
ncbi:MAG: Fe-S cluster assembly ATPase SufC [Anaerolineaceae bacterium]|nr:Fe-S cluster assembly ATPase SufC [Anaerolineaceae bacterium]